MIGSAKITYTNENVCQLVRKDLVDKFGNRELANYNLYLPGVIVSKAVVEQFPNPDVKVTSVEEQIRQMGVYPKQQVPRNPESVRVDTDFGPLSSVFDYKERELIISGGPVAFTDQDGTKAHWYGIIIDFPLGFMFAEDDLIAYSLNGEPNVHKVTDDEADSGFIEILADAKFTTCNLLINWASNYAPELISTLCNASLESQAIEKIPEFPTQPKFEFVYPTGVSVESNVQVDVDLDLGKY